MLGGLFFASFLKISPKTLTLLLQVCDLELIMAQVYHLAWVGGRIRQVDKLAPKPIHKFPLRSNLREVL